MAYSNLYASFFVICQKAVSAWSFVWQFKPTRFYILALSLTQIASWWGSIFIHRQLLGDILVRHYTVDFGIDLIGSPGQIFFLPVFGLAVVLLNFVLSLLFAGRRDFSVQLHLLLSGALIFGLLLNLALFFLYLINFK